MAGTTSDWEGELGRWLKPFLDRLGHGTVPAMRRNRCPRSLGLRTQKGGDRGEQPLLQADKSKLCKRSLVGRQRRDPRLAQLAVGREPPPEIELGRLVRQPADRDRDDLPFRECLAEATEVGFQPANHDRSEVPRTNFDAAGEPLRIEHLKQRREAV